jgi:hypothetical protein
MTRRSAFALVAWLVLAGTLLALEAVGTLRSVDADKGIVVVHAGGKDRTLKADPKLKVRDTAGKDLAGGLRSPELKPGGEVTITVERAGNELMLTELQLGKKASAQGAAVEGGKASFGFKPLTEMTADDRYKGEDGGLYGGGRNSPPEPHLAAARQASARITPRDASGQPAKDGTIVLVSISMSNATQEFSTFKRLADADPDKSPRVTIVDCAQGGQAMAQWVDPQAKAWAEAARRLQAAGVTPEQVQVAWIKLANVAPSGELNEHGRKLQRDTRAVLHNARARFPNLQIAYLSSRIYGGWSTGRLNPEPFAYEGAFAVRWLIQDQMKADAALNHDPERGPAKAPVLLWGPYLWADGTTPRQADGLVWERRDLVGDGVHPSDSGRQKVANLLLNFFKTDPLARTWFVQPSAK